MYMFQSVDNLFQEVCQTENIEICLNTVIYQFYIEISVSTQQNKVLI